MLTHKRPDTTLQCLICWDPEGFYWLRRRKQHEDRNTRTNVENPMLGKWQMAVSSPNGVWRNTVCALLLTCLYWNRCMVAWPRGQPVSCRRNRTRGLSTWQCLSWEFLVSPSSTLWPSISDWSSQSFGTFPTPLSLLTAPSMRNIIFWPSLLPTISPVPWPQPPRYHHSGGGCRKWFLSELCSSQSWVQASLRPTFATLLIIWGSNRLKLLPHQWNSVATLEGETLWCLRQPLRYPPFQKPHFFPCTNGCTSSCVSWWECMLVLAIHPLSGPMPFQTLFFGESQAWQSASWLCG